MNYYAIGDIHGYLDILKSSMKNVHLEDNPESKLIFLGDYIDNGPNSASVLYYIKELFERYNGQVVALIGNHEEMFLEWLLHPKEYVNYFIEDKDLNTLGTFLNKEELKEFLKRINSNNSIIEISEQVADIIKHNHKNLIVWLKKLPYYYETEKQIFVHAGIDEETEELWKIGTAKEYFTNKFPPSTGWFYKDIIAGHVGISSFKQKSKMKNIFYDGKSHFYIDGIDGNNDKNKIIPILKYDFITKEYTTYK